MGGVLGGVHEPEGGTSASRLNLRNNARSPGVIADEEGEDRGSSTRSRRCLDGVLDPTPEVLWRRSPARPAAVGGRRERVHLRSLASAPGGRQVRRRPSLFTHLRRDGGGRAALCSQPAPVRASAGLAGGAAIAGGSSHPAAQVPQMRARARAAALGRPDGEPSLRGRL